jgi:hypothetical protein
VSARPLWPALALTAMLIALPACGGNGAADGNGVATAPGEQEFPPTDTEAVPPGGFTEDEVALSLEDQDTADIVGTAFLTPEGETSTHVAVHLDEFPEGESTAEIREGRCEEPDAEVAHEVATLDEGYGEATVDAALEDLMAADFALWAVGPDGDDIGCALIAAFGADLD